MSDTSPQVSLIVPAYNAASTLPRFIDSIARQTYRPIELVIVNDGSCDNTQQLVSAAMARYSHLTIILHNQENQGMTRARNVGYLRSHGEYVWFLDSDMELPTGKEVESCVALCIRDSYDGLMIPERSQGTGFWARCRGFEKRINDDDLHKNAVRFMKRIIPERIGLYDAALTAAEDYEFHNRVREAGFSFTLASGVYIYHYEVHSLRKMMKKAFYYGKSMPLYLKRRPKESFQQFFIIRPAYIRNWRLFFQDPLSGMGMLCTKTLQYVAASVGMLYYIINRNK